VLSACDRSEQRRTASVVPLGFFIEVTAVLGFRVGGVGGIAIGARVHIALIHQRFPALEALLVAGNPQCGALWAGRGFGGWHLVLLALIGVNQHQVFLFIKARHQQPELRVIGQTGAVFHEIAVTAGKARVLNARAQNPAGEDGTVIAGVFEVLGYCAIEGVFSRDIAHRPCFLPGVVTGTLKHSADHRHDLVSVVGGNVANSANRQDPMQQFLYELHFESDAHVEINDLFAANHHDALAFFDNLFLELHVENTQHPSVLVLRERDTGDELARYTTHFDAVAT